MNKKYFLKTLGCQMNILDSTYIQILLNRVGSQTQDIRQADIIILNTCSVKETSENKLLNILNFVKKIKKYRKNVFISVVGCFVEKINFLFFKSHTYINCYVSPNYIHCILYFLKIFFLTSSTHICICKKKQIVKKNVKTQLNFIEDIIKFNLSCSDTSSQKVYIRIMKGCNKFCTYCIVPYTRGLEFCRSLESIITDIKSVRYKDVKEIILLGQSVNHYYHRNINFYKLLYIISNTISTKTKIKFLTNYPKNIVYPLLNLMKKTNRILNILHIPIQSGSNKILKKMNRNYTKESYAHIVNIAYKKIPNLLISSDMIVGFPGECTYDFRESINILKYTRYSNLFISQYSPRPKTVSYIYNTDDICKSVKSARHNYMLKVQSNLSYLKNHTLLNQIFRADITYVYNSDFYINKVILIAKTHGNQQIIFTFNSKFFFNKEVLIKVTKVYKSKIFGEILL